MQKGEDNRADELRTLGWGPEDVRRYEELWEYRQRWGAINLEREDRAFLRKAESALPKRLSGKGSEKKRIQDKSHYRWLAFYLEAMRQSPAETAAADAQGAWTILLEEELRCLDYYEPVLGLPDTLKARELVSVRETLIASAAQQGHNASFDFLTPLAEYKTQNSCNWKPLRGEGNTDSSYPMLGVEAAAAFRAQVRQTLPATIRALLPSLQDSDKPEPPTDWGSAAV